VVQSSSIDLPNLHFVLHFRINEQRPLCNRVLYLKTYHALKKKTMLLPRDNLDDRRGTVKTCSTDLLAWREKTVSVWCRWTFVIFPL